MSATDAWTIVGALAAVVAAIFAALAWRQGGQTAKTVDERYQREVEPIPRVIAFDAGRRTLLVSNAGGAARHVVVVWDYRERPGTILIAGGAVAGHSTGTELPVAFFDGQAGQAHVRDQPTLVAAKDLLNQWWDCNVGRPIADWAVWWANATTALGVPNLQAVESPDGQTIVFQHNDGA